MPIPPAPYTLKCPKCDWWKIYVPASDVLRHPGQCPRCGYDQLKLTFQSLNPLLGSLVREITRIGKAFRSRS